MFDKDGDGRLKHSEFCDAFLPIDALLASKLAHTPPQDKFQNINIAEPHQVKNYRENMFNHNTKNDFAEVWKTHFGICRHIV